MSIDMGVIRGIGTLTLLASFVLLCIWAWLPRQRARFEEASLLPFLGEQPGAKTAGEDR